MRRVWQRIRLRLHTVHKRNYRQSRKKIEDDCKHIWITPLYFAIDVTFTITMQIHPVWLYVLAGVDGGAAALRIFRPTLTVYTIEQNQLIPGARNILTTTISTNCNLQVDRATLRTPGASRCVLEETREGLRSAHCSVEIRFYFRWFDI